MKAVDDKTSQLNLNERLGLVLVAPGKLSSNMPFIMPKRVAGTPKDTQISEYVGSGPFVFDAANWKPGDKAVNVDTFEWISIMDHNTAVNALISGEVNYIESPRRSICCRCWRPPTTSRWRCSTSWAIS